MRYERETKSEMDALSLLSQSKMEDRLEGEKVGIEKGKLEGRLETARNMKKDGMAPASIHKLTGIAIDTIEKL